MVPRQPLLMAANGPGVPFGSTDRNWLVSTRPARAAAGGTCPVYWALLPWWGTTNWMSIPE